MRLANPQDVVATGEAYRAIYEWTLAHSKDTDLKSVLERLEPEGMYPEWRRQALEDTYLLFYEDVVRSKDQKLSELPPPPKSKPVANFRPAPGGGDDESAIGSGWYERGNRMWHSQRWDYEICKTGGPTPKTPREGAGRSIVSKGMSTRYCACAVDPLGTLWGDKPPPWDRRPKAYDDALENEGSSVYTESEGLPPIGVLGTGRPAYAQQGPGNIDVMSPGASGRPQVPQRQTPLFGNGPGKEAFPQPRAEPLAEGPERQEDES